MIYTYISIHPIRHIALNVPSCQSYLIFVISFTPAGFLNLNILHPKITKNTQKLQQIAPKSVKYAFFAFNLETCSPDRMLLHTRRDCGFCNKYQVCVVRCKFLCLLLEETRTIVLQVCAISISLESHTITHTPVRPMEVKLKSMFQPCDCLTSRLESSLSQYVSA